MSAPLSPSAGSAPLKVVAAVIRREDGHVLVSLRAPHLHQGGLWEFPGGKLEPRERPVDGLARELLEELGITIEWAVPLIRILHRYPDRLVELEVLEVKAWEGTPRGCEGQTIAWVAPTQLGQLEFPAANLPIVTALELPHLVLDAPICDGDEGDYFSRLERCLDAGIDLVRFTPALGGTGGRLRQLSNAVRLCRRYDARIVIDGDLHDAIAAGASGAHLSGDHLEQVTRRGLPAGFMLSATCGSADEIRIAEHAGVDFAFVAPVRHCRARHFATALGWHQVRALAMTARMPLYAAGGVAAGDIRTAARSGCQGVAVSGALWHAADPREVIKKSVQGRRDAACRASKLSAYERGV